MASESDRAAESNSLQPSVPASAASRDIRSLAPGWEGGSPSSLTTVASTTSSPRASRRASSSSTLGMHAAATQHGVEDLARPHHLSRRGGVTGRQAQAAERLLEAHPGREQDVRRVERPRCASRTAGGGKAGEVERQPRVLAAPAGKDRKSVV